MQCHFLHIQRGSRYLMMRLCFPRRRRAIFCSLSRRRLLFALHKLHIDFCLVRTGLTTQLFFHDAPRISAATPSHAEVVRIIIGRQ